MKVTLIEPGGERHTLEQVAEYAFSNSDTFGLPDTLAYDDGIVGSMLIVNSRNFVALEISDDD